MTANSAEAHPADRLLSVLPHNGRSSPLTRREDHVPSGPSSKPMKQHRGDSGSRPGHIDDPRLQSPPKRPSFAASEGGTACMDLVPDAGQLSRLMSQATAPAFVLGAVAAFVAVLLGRMTNVLDRIRNLNEI